MKKVVSTLIVVAVFLALTAGAVVMSINTVSDFALEKNKEKTALVQNRLDETIALLKDLSRDEYIRSSDPSFLDKAQYLTDKNNNEQLGYMMVRILDENINIYKEGMDGPASNLGSRDYMQAMYKTGEGQVTDAFLAGADGTTINYTVTEAIMEDGKVTSSLMAAIYGDQIDGYLQDETSVNVLVGSLYQYMGGIPTEQFGLPVAQVLETDVTTSRPVENVLTDFNEEKSGSFWSIGSGGIRYYAYSPMDNCQWIVMTEVNALSLAKNILIVYGCVVIVLIVAAALILRKRSRA